MARSSLKFNREGFRKIRHEPKVRAFLKKKAEEVAKDASNGGAVSGYIVTDLVLEKPRAAFSVMAAKGEARKHNRETHALVRAVIANRSR